MPGGCVYEPKWDGYRIVIVVDATGTVRLWSRQGTRRLRPAGPLGDRLGWQPWATLRRQLVLERAPDQWTTKASTETAVDLAAAFLVPNTLTVIVWVPDVSPPYVLDV
jgi:hypothetical protein